MHPLLDVRSVPDLPELLAGAGEVFAVFDLQDSGCVSYGVRTGEERWFVKTARTAAAVAGLERAVAFHATVRHPAIIGLRHAFTAGGWPVLVYPWRSGELLYHATRPRTGDRTSPDSPMARFRALPVPEVERVLDTILAAHVVVEDAGFVAVDFYDGCILYDFAERRVHLLDFDEYRPGPFVATEELSGSVRFMAPEEHVVGATIDSRTMVFTLGRTIRVLLDAGDDEAAWRGSSAQLAVVRRATNPDPTRRHGSVQALSAAWSAAESVAGRD